MKKTLLAASVSLAALSGTAAQAMDDVIVAFAGTEDLQNDAEYVFIHAFAESLEDHGVNVIVHPSNTMGKESDRFDQTSQGLISVNIGNGGSLMKASKWASTLFLPFLTSDEASFDRLVEESDALERINEEASRLGIKVAGFAMRGGTLGLFNTQKPVTTLADVSDMRLRAQNGDQVTFMSEWGAKPTVVSWAETPNALQTGVAVGHFNPPSTVVAAGQVELLDYFTPLDAGPVPKVIMLSDDWYSFLTEEEQVWVDDAIADGIAVNRAWALEQASYFEQKILEGGVEITPLAEGERAKFIEASRSVWNQIVPQKDVDYISKFVD
ncbi:TRAP transporter substrate-binding protein [Salipiger mucosus]|uniref:TRAP-type C4-dicarboxylate transport system, periplasmic component n=1 Tax=Salipiger mucosus DSM 16094 TaxID=1123237 RepID=S9QVU7_9RHOB|nr:TRAP transporter substrate-binding protein [Salipiger mucosus]EPX83733.1 TRAP-type C4-dicarboxylate transport system, periplasmic component [Salipiger mucosus DSM 16094]